jgi:hypothetical protein
MHERFLVGKPEGKRTLGRTRSIREDNITMDLKMEVSGQLQAPVALAPAVTVPPPQYPLIEAAWARKSI